MRAVEVKAAVSAFFPRHLAILGCARLGGFVTSTKLLCYPKRTAPEFYHRLGRQEKGNPKGARCCAVFQRTVPRDGQTMGTRSWTSKVLLSVAQKSHMATFLGATRIISSRLYPAGGQEQLIPILHSWEVLEQLGLPQLVLLEGSR